MSFGRRHKRASFPSKKEQLQKSREFMVEDLSKSGLNDDHIKRSKSYKPCTQIDALKRYKYDGVGYEIDYPDPRTGKLTDPLGKLVA